MELRKVLRRQIQEPMDNLVINLSNFEVNFVHSYCTCVEFVMCYGSLYIIKNKYFMRLTLCQ